MESLGIAMEQKLQDTLGTAMGSLGIAMEQNLQDSRAEAREKLLHVFSLSKESSHPTMSMISASRSKIDFLDTFLL